MDTTWKDENTEQNAVDAAKRAEEERDRAAERAEEERAKQDDRVVRDAVDRAARDAREVTARVQAMQAAEQRYWKTCCRVAREQNAKRCPVCKTDLPYYAPGHDLRLGDVVTTFTGSATHSYSHATVKKITEKEVTFFRPYVATANFTYTGGVITYLGYEEYTFGLNDVVQVLQESTILDVVRNETDEGRLVRSGEAERQRVAAQVVRNTKG
jgi:hypothetical protein